MTGKRLRELRKASGLTGEQLAEKAEISKGYVSQLETGGHQNTSAMILVKIAEALNTTIYDILEVPMYRLAGNPEMPPSLQEMIERSGERLGLTKNNIEMLKHINYRGRQPTRWEDWEYLFNTIKLVTNLKGA